MVNCSTSTQRYQQGMALVLVVFIVALVATISLSSFRQQFIQIRQLDNSNLYAQAVQYALGVEAWGLEQLKRDKFNSRSDHLNEEWTKPLPTTNIDNNENITVAGRIEDLNGMFDVNRTVRNSKIDNNAYNSMMRYLQRVGGENENPANAIVDWIDSDTQSRSGGAEYPYYLSKSPAYYAANRPLAHINEAWYIRNFDPEILEDSKLVALPRQFPYNVNTLDIELFPVVFTSLTESHAASLVSIRESTPWETIGDFTAAVKTLDENAAASISSIPISISSFQFRIESFVKFNDIQLSLHSYVLRDNNGGTTVFQRTLDFLQ